MSLEFMYIYIYRHIYLYIDIYVYNIYIYTIAPEWENTKRMILATELSKLRNSASATPKQQGPEGRKSIKIATKNSLM